ncbi:MAG: hypothetical protein ACLSE4_05220 [Clostridium sp.]
MRNVKVFALMGVIAVTAAGCGQKQEAAPKNDTSVAAETLRWQKQGRKQKTRRQRNRSGSRNQQFQLCFRRHREEPWTCLQDYGHST